MRVRVNYPFKYLFWPPSKCLLLDSSMPWVQLHMVSVPCELF